MDTITDNTSGIKPAFTPAPWKTDPEVGHQSVLGPDGIMVADCAIFVNPKFGERNDAINAANARLIAAAPELFAALQSVVDALDAGHPPHLETYDKARNALRKAEGR